MGQREICCGDSSHSAKVRSRYAAMRSLLPSKLEYILSQTSVNLATTLLAVDAWSSKIPRDWNGILYFSNVKRDIVATLTLSSFGSAYTKSGRRM
jgi:hypothetical protein